MRNVHLLKHQKALQAFVQATYDLENLEPEAGTMLREGNTAQAETIMVAMANLQRVLLKMTGHARTTFKGGKYHAR